jgi:pilus biogenesis lipoprotein CpaD
MLIFSRAHQAGLCLLLLALTGCITDRPYDASAKNPDNRIVVAPASPNSKILKAWAPECLAWTDHRPSYYDNGPQPQIGCANQRNLALMIAQPADLVQPQPLGRADATKAASSMQRYHENKVLGLHDPTQPPAAKE